MRFIARERIILQRPDPVKPRPPCAAGGSRERPAADRPVRGGQPLYSNDSWEPRVDSAWMLLAATWIAIALFVAYNALHYVLFRLAAHPKSGILPSSCLAMNRSGSGETERIAGTSTLLVWLETKT